uniref:Aminotransferase-like plant mobile domain-containing protein n=2 Tax=Triticinae TaxID=1648030 RepID=A0A7M1IEH8_WHEAT|nr:hypothetical protein [Triticum aestivum]QOQ37969.1 hypothetical protein [Triticum aestivum]
MVQPMRMPPPPYEYDDYDPTRGTISCFTDHGLADDPISAATLEALRVILVGHYDEAFRRLPVEDMPDGLDLAQLADRGGFCLGLLDPVTNIVLNTISLLPHGFEFDANPSPPPSGTGRRIRMPSDPRNASAWHGVACRSIGCLLEFMRAYFGLLSEEQAGRYLVWARADIAMAVLLVEHELYVARPSPPDPRSGRTRQSLRLAAMHVQHPSPDSLVSLATAWLPPQKIEILAPILRHDGGRNRLAVQDVRNILHVLRHQEDISATATLQSPPPLEEGTTSCIYLGDGRIAYTTIVQRAGDHIASLRRPQDTQSMLISYSMAPSSAAHTTAGPRDSPCAYFGSLDVDNTRQCPYVRSLEMSLLGTIHGFYLTALAMLPSYAARHHVRGVLLAGHCYGPMDPVSNIILSTVWYDANFPLPVADRGMQARDILDTLTMLRVVTSSLHGLIALLHANSGKHLSLHEILKYLCYRKCDLATMLQPHLHRSSPNPFASAAAAARHPQASAWATFLSSLAPTKLDQIRSLMISATANNTVLSYESLTQIYNILREETRTAMILPAPRLCRTAVSILTRKREAYAHQQSFIRGRIEQLLLEYARRHPSETKYDLDFICGVAVAVTGHQDQCYHVNFMAATKSTSKNTLFFAEFWWAYQDQSKPSLCCPLPQPYTMGRCYYGQESARKLAYPDDSIDYLSLDITPGGLDDTEGILDTDFLYFDSERDVELAKVLQRMGKKEEVLQRSSTGRRAEWTAGVPLC